MLEQPQVECSVIHRFAPGVYVREVTVPAGTFAVGHFQKTEHLCVMTRGRVTLVHDDGSREEIAAPYTYVAKPGRKVGYVHEDMTWLNVYATDERDVTKLEATYLHKSDNWLASQPALLTHHGEDEADYFRALADTGFDHETAKAQSEMEADLRPFPNGSFKVRVAPSAIAGDGLFATAPIEAGELIAPARIGGLRTPAGRYTNHSASPNAAMVATGAGDIDLVALRDIAGARGGGDGEEITVDYRESVRVCRSLGVSQ
jgi:hypothetical protein